VKCPIKQSYYIDFSMGMLDTNDHISRHSIDSRKIYSYKLSVLNAVSSVFNMSSPSSPSHEETFPTILNQPRHLISLVHQPPIWSDTDHLHRVLTMNFTSPACMTTYSHCFPLESMSWDMTEVLRLTCVENTREWLYIGKSSDFWIEPLS
jgi:hypothetical protein